MLYLIKTDILIPYCPLPEDMNVLIKILFYEADHVSLESLQSAMYEKKWDYNKTLELKERFYFCHPFSWTSVPLVPQIAQGQYIEKWEELRHMELILETHS